MGNLQVLGLGLLLLLSAASASSGSAEYMQYKDPRQPVDVRIKDLMQRMTLAEKIGQMTQVERKVATAQVMKDYFIGKMSGNRSVHCYVPSLCMLY